MSETKPERPVVNSADYDFPSVTKPMGYLYVDHRNSPGLPEHIARLNGFDPALTKEGKVFEGDTLACGHCFGVFLKQHGKDMIARCADHGPICDACVIASHDPNYVHRGRQELLDMLHSGIWAWAGGTTSLPILTRKEPVNG